MDPDKLRYERIDPWHLLSEKLMIHRTQHKRGEGDTGKRFKEKDRDLPPKLKTQVWQNRGKKLPTANRCKQSYPIPRPIVMCALKGGKKSQTSTPSLR